jgi:cytochrome c1
MSDHRADEYRSKCLSEKEEKCVVCGEEEYIVIHHADGDRSNDGLQNLISVCHECHGKIHAGDEDVAEWAERLPPDAEREGSRSIRFTVEAGQYERMREAKDKHGFTWKGLMLKGMEHLEAEDHPVL